MSLVAISQALAAPVADCAAAALLLGRIRHLVLTLSLGLTLTAALQLALRKLDPGGG